MILDEQLVFSSAQSVTATAISTNVLDLGSTNSKLGTGEPLYFVCNVTTAIADNSGTDLTIIVTLEGDTQVGLDGTAEVIVTLPTFVHGDAAGTRYIARVPPGYPTKRYLGVVYTVANGTATAGFDAFLTHDIDAFTAYPKSSGAVIGLL